MPHPNHSAIDPNTPIWTCPNVQTALDRQYPEGVGEKLHQVIVVGQQVNVRARPDRTSSVVGQLSNEVVQFDSITWRQIPPEEQVTQLDSSDSWTPVSLPNQRSGYVLNRYVYFPLGSQAVFGKIKGNWQLLYILEGE